MAQGGEEQDKSETATPFKLDQARRKGMVARGMDLGFFTALTGFAIAAEVMGADLVQRLAQTVRRTFTVISSVGAAPYPTIVAARESMAILGLLAAPAFILLALGIVVEIVQLRGLVFSAEPLKPDFSRLNPAKGLKRVFSLRMLKELLKSLIKFAVYGAAAFLYIRHAGRELAQRAGNGRDLAPALVEAAGDLLLLFLILAAALAMLDQVMARREFAKQMRMSRRDVTRETREREGEPRQKQKRKQILAEILQQAAAAANVKGADVLIVNPIHYAVALRYRPELGDAPVIQARGRNAYARRMRDAARKGGVVIVRNPRLARALYHEGVVDRPISAAHFVAVADIYIMLRRALQQQAEQAAPPPR